MTDLNREAVIKHLDDVDMYVSDNCNCSVSELNYKTELIVLALFDRIEKLETVLAAAKIVKENSHQLREGVGSWYPEFFEDEPSQDFYNAVSDLCVALNQLEVNDE